MTETEYAAALKEIGEVRTLEEAEHLELRLIDRYRGQQGFAELRDALAQHVATPYLLCRTLGVPMDNLRLLRIFGPVVMRANGN